MRKTKVCPKCGANDIVVVPGGVGGPYAGNNIHVGFLRSPVGVARYLCCDCGFIEEWVDDPKDLEKIKRKFEDK